VTVRARLLIAAFLVTLASGARADEPNLPPERAPLVTNIARIRVDFSRRHVVVVHEVNLAAGAFHGEDVDYFVAFGAPGAPVAFDARLVPVERGALEPSAGNAGLALEWSYATRRPTAARPLVGRGTMSGIALHVPGEALSQALARGGLASLRLRAIHLLPPPSTNGARELVVRLGDDDRGPLALGRVEIAATEPRFLGRVEARLCRRDGTDGDLLAARVLGRPKDGVPKTAAILANRAPSDDVCLRFWSGT
jgi:hypothetical protein